LQKKNKTRSIDETFHSLILNNIMGKLTCITTEKSHMTITTDDFCWTLMEKDDFTCLCIHPANVLFHPPAVRPNNQTIIIITHVDMFALVVLCHRCQCEMFVSFTWWPPYLCASGTEPGNSFPPLTQRTNSSFWITDSFRSKICKTSWNTQKSLNICRNNIYNKVLWWSHGFKSLRFKLLYNNILLCFKK